LSIVADGPVVDGTLGGAGVADGNHDLHSTTAPSEIRQPAMTPIR
jgi:hypothetical protein